MLQRRGLGFGISPRSTTANSTTSSRRSTPFLLSLLHLMAISAAMTISLFQSTANMVYPSWTAREQGFEGKTRREDDAWPNFYRRIAPWTTAADDAALISLLPSLLFHLLSSVRAGERRLGLLGMDTETQRDTLHKRKKNRRPGLGHGREQESTMHGRSWLL